MGNWVSGGTLAEQSSKYGPIRFWCHPAESRNSGNRSFGTNAVVASDTDWPAIAALYGQLDAMSSSPVVRLNWAVAIAMSDGPLAGLKMLDDITELDSYHLLWATRGELSRRASRTNEARAAFARALDLAPHGAERRHLERRIAMLGD